MYANYNDKLERLTDCCAAYSTYTEDGALCCKACWEEVESGQGDHPEAPSQTINGQIGRPADSTLAPDQHRWVQWHQNDDDTWTVNGFRGWVIRTTTTTDEWDIALVNINKLAKLTRQKETI